MNKFGIAALILIVVLLAGFAALRPHGAEVQNTSDFLTYTNAEVGYSVEYPKDFTLDANYSYQAMGPGKEVRGVKFTIPASMATGTNLSSDTGVSVETTTSSTCTAADFLDTTVSTSTLAEGNTTYVVAKGGGAAAGNLYDEYVYILQNLAPCTAIRYFIHSTQLANYPEGTVVAFDQSALVAKFDAIRRSLKFSK
jgi:hypothetical protein